MAVRVFKDRKDPGSKQALRMSEKQEKLIDCHKVLYLTI
jgi:hypothetical protein